jgi:hypothetical protein
MLNGIVSITNLGPPLEWIEASPTIGNVVIGETDTILITFNTTGMEAGIYFCELKVFSDADTVAIPVTLYVDWVGIENTEYVSKIYPNPSTGVFNIIPGIPEEYTIEIYDIYGRKIWQQNKVQGATKWIASPDINNGVYILKISGNNSNEMYRLVLHQ